MMKSRNLAGILIVPSSASSISQLKELQDRGIPVVMLDRTFAGLDADAVMVENRQGAKKAVHHLVDHGHRNILCVGYDRQFNSIAQRMEGYESIMVAAGLKPQFLVLDEGSRLGPQLLKRIRSSRPPTALFTLNNVTTSDVLSMLQRENIQVPHDVAIVGFDDFELAGLLAVPLTAVRQPAAELGRSATKLLLDAVRSLSTGVRLAHSQIVLPTELITRRSCGCEAIRRIDGNRTRLAI